MNIAKAIGVLVLVVLFVAMMIGDMLAAGRDDEDGVQ